MKKILYKQLNLIAIICIIIGFLATNYAISAPKYTIKLAYENGPTEPAHFAAQKWAELFKDKTNGEGEIRLYPSSQLGSKKDVIEQMQLGMGVVTLANGGFFADYVPDFGIMMGPYLGKDYKDVIKLSQTPWFKNLATQLDNKGLHILAANWLYGTRHLITKKPIKTPQDLKGLKIRVPNTRMFVETFNNMGAIATPMPMSEVYTALTTGVIDGAENPISVLYGQKTFEPAKYVILTGHIDDVTNIVIGQKYFSKLPKNIQLALTESSLEAGEFMTKLVNEAEQKDLEKMKKEGAIIIEVDKNLFRDATRKTYTKFPEWENNLFESIQSLIK